MKIENCIEGDADSSSVDVTFFCAFSALFFPVRGENKENHNLILLQKLLKGFFIIDD